MELDTNLMHARFYILRNVSMLHVTESTKVYLFSFHASSSSSSSTAEEQASILYIPIEQNEIRF